MHRLKRYLISKVKFKERRKVKCESWKFDKVARIGINCEANSPTFHFNAGRIHVGKLVKRFCLFIKYLSVMPHSLV